MKSLETGLTVLVLAATLVGVATAQFKPQIEEGEVDVPRGDIFIRNADAVWTANDTIYRGVSILVRNGIIREIGSDIDAPNGVQLIDGTGFTIIPGFVDEHSHIATRAVNECTAPVVPEVRVADALDAESFGIYRALSGGVTTAQVLHGSCNPIGGQSAIIKTRWGMDDPRKLLVQGAPQTFKFALGENVTRKNWDADRARFPASRQGVEALYVHLPLQMVHDAGVFLASDASGELSGRLISAVADDFANLPPRIPEIMASDAYTIRRVELK